MTTKEMGRPHHEAAPNQKHPDSTGDNSTAAQRRRALEALETGPKSTIELRRRWDILSPAPRIKELRDRGYVIVTNWVQHATDCGNLHRVALYVLVSSAAAGTPG